MSRRRRAREVVLQILYQDDLNTDTPATVEQSFIKGRLQGDRQLIAFANELLSGVRERRDQLDQWLSRVAVNWRLSRMAVTDRNVLRLGAFEILFSDTPERVAINEAIDLAKRYGTNQSSQFVNGILDRVMRSKSELGTSDLPACEPDSSEDAPSSH